MFKKLVLTVICLTFLSLSSQAFAEDVYVTKNGKKFHKAECPLIKNKKGEKAAKKEVMERGLTPCQKCFKEETSLKEEKNQNQSLLNPDRNLTPVTVG